jgi:hypothetical protein
MRTGSLAAASALLVVGMLAAPPASAAGTFSYIVQSNGPILSASFFDGMNELQTVSGLPASWSQTFASQATYQMTSITAQTNGTQISCQLIKNGSLVDQQTTTGRYTVVSCTG